MAKKVAVVTRKLSSYHESVITAVIGSPHNIEDVDDSYFEKKASEIINEFIEKFPEFNRDNADWKVTITELTY